MDALERYLEETAKLRTENERLRAMLERAAVLLPQSPLQAFQEIKTALKTE